MRAEWLMRALRLAGLGGEERGCCGMGGCGEWDVHVMTCDFTLKADDTVM